MINTSFEMVGVSGTWLIQSPESEVETKAWQTAIEAAGNTRLMGTLRNGLSDKAQKVPIFFLNDFEKSF